MLEDKLGALVQGARDVVDAMQQTTVDAADEMGGLVRESVGELCEAVDATAGAVREALPKTDDLIAQAALLPGVRVDREKFLSDAFRGCDARTVDQAMATSPLEAGIPLDKLSRVAGKALGKEARRTTVLSMASGLPGVATAAATIPADLVQFYGHLLRAIQMLSYLYGWRDTCSLPEGEPDEGTRLTLVLFLGVMAGDERADALLERVARIRPYADVRTTIARNPVTRQVADSLGSRMVHRVGGQAVGKAVPIAGAIIGGTLSYGGFSDMWKRLRMQLERIESGQKV